jgi:predicted acyl esterase
VWNSGKHNATVTAYAKRAIPAGLASPANAVGLITAMQPETLMNGGVMAKKYKVYRISGEYTDSAPLTKALSYERAIKLQERFSKKSPHLTFVVK